MGISLIHFLAEFSCIFHLPQKFLTPQMLEVIHKPLKMYIEGIRHESNNEMLRADLRFVLALTNNRLFMKWIRTNGMNLFTLMNYNLDKSFVNLETVDLAVQVHYNLLIDLEYSIELVEDKASTTSIFSLDMAEERWMTNIVVLSYITTYGIDGHYSSFLYKLNSMLFKEIEEGVIDPSKINRIVTMMRKYCTNVFKGDNEVLAKQVA